MRIWVGLAVAAVAGAVAAEAQPPAEIAWTPIAEDRDGDYFYDAASVERRDGFVRLRLREVADGEPVHGIRSVVVLVEIDCAGQHTHFLAAEMFGADGAAVHSRIRPGALSSPRPIWPGSPEETLYRQLCPPALVRPLPESYQFVVTSADPDR